jgi:hypothetical protein
MQSIDDPEYLRLRAAEMRSRAAEAVYPETGQSLLRIAADCDLLAVRAEQRTAAMARLTGLARPAPGSTPASDAGVEAAPNPEGRSADGTQTREPAGPAQAQESAGSAEDGSARA